MKKVFNYKSSASEGTLQRKVQVSGNKLHAMILLVY